MPTGAFRDFYVALVDSNGNVVSGANPIPVSAGTGSAPPNGVQSGFSNSDTPLGSNATFTPSGGANNGFDDLYALGVPSAIEVSIATNVISAYLTTVPGIQVQWSRDGTNVDTTDGAIVHSDTPLGGVLGSIASGGPLGNVPNGLNKTFSFDVQSGFQYCRVLYNNGGSAQATFHMRTTYRYNPIERNLMRRYSTRYGSWEAVPCNEAFTVLSSQASAAIRSTGKRVNLMHIGAILNLNVTVQPATPAGLDVSLEVSYDGTNFFRVNQILTGAFITTTGVFNFIWHPQANNLSTGLSATTAKQAVGFPFPLFWQVRVLPQDGQSYTYSMQVALITQ